MYQDAPGGPSRLRAPAVVGSLVLVILVLGCSAAAYALTRSSPAPGTAVPAGVRPAAPQSP